LVDLSSEAVEVISVGKRLRVRKCLVSRAAVGDVVGAANSMGHLVKGGSTTDIARSNSGAGAKAGGGNLVEEDTAEVDVCRRNEGISNNTSRAGTIGVSAAQCARRGVLISDCAEDGGDTGGSSSTIVSPV